MCHPSTPVYAPRDATAQDSWFGLQKCRVGEGRRGGGGVHDGGWEYRWAVIDWVGVGAGGWL